MCGLFMVHKKCVASGINKILISNQTHEYQIFIINAMTWSYFTLGLLMPMWIYHMIGLQDMFVPYDPYFF